MTDTPIRDAATIILVRDRDTRPSVLMGQRGATAAFMPNKFVFPGGAVDAADADIPNATTLNELCATRLSEASLMAHPHAIATAAIRELWEESGLIMGKPGAWPSEPPADWKGFADTGHLPAAHGLTFVFRAITPPGRPRRFDARFFLADADVIVNDLDDFSAACEELSHLQWVALEEARSFNLPFITEVVLAEVASALPDMTAPATVPFFYNDDESSLFKRLDGLSPLERQK